MWKRIFNVIGNNTLKSSNHELSRQIARQDENMLKANIKLRNAIKGIPSHPISALKYPINEVKSWQVKPFNTLKVDQLEELAKHKLEGTVGINKDIDGAIKIWQSISINSLESSYSLAVCKREGLGIPKDLTAAFQELLKLADINDYGPAHVSSHIIF